MNQEAPVYVRLPRCKLMKLEALGAESIAVCCGLETPVLVVLRLRMAQPGEELAQRANQALRFIMSDAVRT